MNSVCIQVSVYISAVNSFQFLFVTRRGIAGLNDNSLFNFFEESSEQLHYFTFPSAMHKDSIIPISSLTCYFFVFLINIANNGLPNGVVLFYCKFDLYFPND